MQQPFQEGMDRLLGAAERPQGAALDEQVATERVASTPRAATFEQFPMTSTSQVSRIAILQDGMLIVSASFFDRTTPPYLQKRSKKSLLKGEKGGEHCQLVVLLQRGLNPR